MSKSITCHSEYLKLEKVYIKDVSEAYESKNKIDKEWEKLNFLAEPNFNKAKAEYSVFRSIFEQRNIDVATFKQNDAVTIDSVYCRDASIATDFGAIICNMGKEGRINEPSTHQEAYNKGGIAILGQIQSPGTLEGGDVAWLDQKTLAVGNTYRTNDEGIRQLKELLEPKGIEIVVVDLPHYKGEDDVFHLMSILSPVAKDLAVVYSPLMPIRFRNLLLKRGFELIEVPDEEFESMGCNVLAIAPRTCVMVEGNPKTQKLLEEAGCEVITYAGNEISVKGGGGPTCLTRPFSRSL